MTRTALLALVLFAVPATGFARSPSEGRATGRERSPEDQEFYRPLNPPQAAVSTTVEGSPRFDEVNDWLEMIRRWAQGWGLFPRR